MLKKSPLSLVFFFLEAHHGEVKTLKEAHGWFPFGDSFLFLKLNVFVIPLKILEHVFPVDKDTSTRTPIPALLIVSKWKQEARHCRSHRYVCCCFIVTNFT